MILGPPSDIDFSSISIDAIMAISKSDLMALAEDFDVLRKTPRAKPYRTSAAKVVGEYLSSTTLTVSPPLYSEDDNISVEVTLWLSRHHLRAGHSRRTIQRLTENVDGLKRSLAVLSSVSHEQLLDCTSYWLPNTYRWLPAISLPLLRVPIPGTPFRQVSGIRLTPEDPSALESAIIDMHSNEGTFRITIGFSVTGSISEGILTEAATAAESLFRGVVIPVSTKERNEDDHEDDSRQAT